MCCSRELVGGVGWCVIGIGVVGWCMFLCDGVCSDRVMCGILFMLSLFSRCCMIGGRVLVSVGRLVLLLVMCVCCVLDSVLVWLLGW